MAMTLRLTDDEQFALQAQAKSDGISMQEAARQAIREYVVRRSHETAVSDAADRIARPRTVVFGVEAYETIWTKAAALLQSIVNNHALIDGNKRLGWLATAVFLELNDIPISQASNDDVYEFVLSVASGSPEFDEIAERLQDLINR